MPTVTKEVRSISGLKLRAMTADDGQKKIGGIIPYNSRSVDLGGFVEMIAPGAFAGALTPGADVLCFRDHKEFLLMGRTKSGTLSLADTADGLTWECILPNSSDADALYESVSRGDLDANSFGFCCVEDSVEWVGDELVRTVISAELMEISPCSFPAYESSSVSLRHALTEIRSRMQKRDDTGKQTDPATRSAFPCNCPCGQCSAGACNLCSIEECSYAGCTCPENSATRHRDDVLIALSIAHQLTQ